MQTLQLTSPMAASSVPAMEGGDLMIMECVSTIHSPAQLIGRESRHMNAVLTRGSLAIGYRGIRN